MRRIGYYALSSLIFFCLTACGSYKELLYFQNLTNTEPFKENIENFSSVTIQQDDILAISVSSLNPEASAVFNINFTDAEKANAQAAGYQVDKNGMIEIPLIGNIKAQGLSTSELRDQIKNRLKEYLKEPVVNIRIVNFKISVMGDIAKPGVYPVQNERITLPEAITLAGDLNVTANRKNLWLIRERNGTREYIPLDLTSKDLFKSQYFYLKNNDLLYIQPAKSKYMSVDNSYTIIAIALSALSIVAIVVTR